MIELAKIAKACSEDKFSHGHCINTIHINHKQNRVEALNGIVCLMQDFETSFTDAEYLDRKDLKPVDSEAVFPDLDMIIPQDYERVSIEQISFWRKKGEKKGKYVLFELMNGKTIFFDNKYLKLVTDFIKKKYDFYFTSENTVAMFKGENGKTALIMPVRHNVSEMATYYDKL